MDRLKPEIIVSSFNERDVHGYISRLTDIQLAFGSEQPILVHIDSYGGSCYGLIMLYEHLKSLGNPIVTFTSSKAMSSGALLLAMAGDPGLRVASPNATILVHEIQAGLGGDIKEMETQMDEVKELNRRILDLFAKCIGLRSANEVRALIKNNSEGHDLCLTAEKAKQLNIVDRVGYIKLEPVMRFDLHINTTEKAKAHPRKERQRAKKKGKVNG